MRLVFAEFDDVKPGDRIFDVSLQGRRVIKDFDIMEEAGARGVSVVREFKGQGIRALSSFIVELTPTESSRLQDPILCGIELVAEE